MELAVVDHLRVGLVGEDHDVVLHGDLGDRLEVLHGEHRAGRVVRRVDDDELGLFGDERGKLSRIEAELAVLAQRRRDGGCADELSHGLVDREAGVRADDLVALVHQREDAEEEDRLRARGDDDLGGLVVGPAGVIEILCVALPSLRQPRRRAVAGEAVLHRLVCGIDDVVRRLEVGLADLEVDDIAALFLKLAGPRQHLKRCLGAKPAHSLREFHDRTPLSMRLWWKLRLKSECANADMAEARRVRGHADARARPAR